MLSCINGFLQTPIRVERTHLIAVSVCASQAHASKYSVPCAASDQELGRCSEPDKKVCMDGAQCINYTAKYCLNSKSLVPKGLCF